MRKDIGHELIICYHEGGEGMARRFPQFPRLNLDRERAGVLTTHERLLELFPKWAQKVFRKVAGPTARPHWEDRIYACAGIQYIVCIAPWNLPSMNLPFSVVIWDLQHRNSPWFPEVGLLHEWNKREEISTTLRRASFIYTGTEQGRLEIQSYYQVPPDRIKVLRFAAPMFAIEAAPRPIAPDFLRRFELPPEYIFYPAQFWGHKNHVLVLEACKILRDTIGSRPVVVFTGSDKGNLDHVREYARRLGLEEQVKFLGFVDQTDMIDLYKAAFCLAFPTFFGPDNLPPLEAFALGCPVVASDVPGAREQLGEAAILFSPTDECALAEAILHLRDHETRERLIKAGHARVQANSWESYIRSLFDSLDEFESIRRAWH